MLGQRNLSRHKKSQEFCNSYVIFQKQYIVNRYNQKWA